MVVRELVALLGVKTDTQSFKKAEGGLDNLVGFAKGAAAAIAGFFAVKWLKSTIDQVTELGDSLQELSDKTGIATDDLQKLKFAAEQSGSSFEDVQLAIKKLQVLQDKIVKGGREEFKTFYKLGVSVYGAGGKMKTATELMMDVSDAFKKMDGDSERTAKSIELFGRSGTSLIPFLRGGSAQIKGMFGELEDLGGIMSGDMVEASDRYRDNLVKLQAGFMGIKIAIAEKLLPELIRLQEQGIAWWKANKNEVMSALKDLDKVAVSLGVVLKLLWDIGVAIATFAKSPAGILAITLLGGQFFLAARGTKLLVKVFTPLVKLIRYARTVVGGALIAFSLWSMIFQSFGKMVKDNTGWAYNLFDALSYLFGFDVVTPVKNIVKWFQKLFKHPLDAIKELRSEWKMMLETIWASLRSAFDGMWSGIFDTVTGWLDKIWSSIVEWWNKIIELPKRAGSWLAEKFGWSGGAPSPSESIAGLSALSRTGTERGMVPRTAQVLGGAGANVNQKTDIKFDIKAAPGMSEKKLADEISRKVSKEIEKQNRAALVALVPGTVGA